MTEINLRTHQIANCNAIRDRLLKAYPPPERLDESPFSGPARATYPLPEYQGSPASLVTRDCGALYIRIEGDAGIFISLDIAGPQASGVVAASEAALPDVLDWLCRLSWAPAPQWELTSREQTRREIAALSDEVLSAEIRQHVGDRVRVFGDGRLGGGIDLHPDGTIRPDTRRAKEAALLTIRLGKRRRSSIAKKAAKTRAKRRDAKVQKAAEAWRAAEGIGRRTTCYVCGRGLTDEASIARGIGPECWDDVLRQAERREAGR